MDASVVRAVAALVAADERTDPQPKPARALLVAVRLALAGRPRARTLTVVTGERWLILSSFPRASAVLVTFSSPASVARDERRVRASKACAGLLYDWYCDVDRADVALRACAAAAHAPAPVLVILEVRSECLRTVGADVARAARALGFHVA